MKQIRCQFGILFTVWAHGVVVNMFDFYRSDPTILFTRLTAIIGTYPDIINHFEYELTPGPTSLFKDSMLRKPVKSTLRNKLLDTVEPAEEINVDACVIDGGALLHKVVWPVKSKYEDVFNQCCHHVLSRYGRYSTISVVFDGYTSSKSTKAQEQARRGSSLSADVTLTKDTSVTVTREMFLRNSNNKQKSLTYCPKT